MNNIISTSTIIPNGLGMTNVVRNVYNFGGNTACDAGTQYCEEGYGLYFPCLKSVTKGQDVCFEFYVTDNSTKDVVDLRDVDAITLDLIGAFGCPYGSFSYPDNISSLQSEEYPVEYSMDFGKRTLCHLSVSQVYTEEEPASELSDIGFEEDYYSGTEIVLGAYDTPTHIFVGWVNSNMIDGEICAEETINDVITSRDNIYKFIITEDTNVIARYRKRKKFIVQNDNDNKMSHFNVVYYGPSDNPSSVGWYPISNRENEIYNDGYDSITVYEGLHFCASCIPGMITFDGRDSSDDDYMYRFIQWKDGVTSRTRVFCAGVDTKAFEDEDKIYLKAECEGPVPVYELEKDQMIPPMDVLDEEGIHLYTEAPNAEAYYDYEGDEHVVSYQGVKQYFNQDNGYLYFKDGNLVLSSAGIEEGISVDIEAVALSGDCEIMVRVNGSEVSQVIGQNECLMYSFYFRPCEKSDIEIIVNGECMVDRIDVCREVIIDKGKAQFCLDGETTANIPSGKLSVGGAIAVNGEAYGLPVTQIGEINKLNKINII